MPTYHAECADVTVGSTHVPAVTHEETVIVTPATDTIVEVTPAHWQRYSWTGGPIDEGVTPSFPSDNWQANVAGDPHGIGVEGAYDVSHGSSGNADWFYLEHVPAVTQTVHTDAVTEVRTVEDVAAYDVPIVEHQCHDVADALVPGYLCHDGDMLWVADTADHIALGDTWECGPEWHPTVEPEPVLTPSEPVAVTPVVDGVPVTSLPACTLEDGSAPDQALPCYWDATLSGNGLGESYVVVSNDLTPSEPLALASTGTDLAGAVLAGALVVAGVVTMMARRALR